MKITIDTETIKARIAENPAASMAAAGALLAGVGKLMNANTARKNSKTWAKEVKRRDRKSH